MVAKLFSDHVDHRKLSDAERGEWSSDLWSLVEEQGLTQPLVPENMGGMGATWYDAFAIVRAAGRHCAPIPLPETIVGGWLLASAQLEVPTGPVSLAGTHPDDVLSLQSSASGWSLNGMANRVPWGRSVGSVVMVLPHDGTHMVVHAPCKGCHVEAGGNVAGEWRDRLVFHGTAVTVALLPNSVFPDIVRTAGAMVRSAQMAGAIADTLERTVAYANERSQFGRLIGKYQAIQQNLAVLATEGAAAAVAAETAFIAADRGDPTLLIAAAKIRAGIAVPAAVGISHQIHGAMGFTMEHSLQWSTRRLMSWRTEFGGERYWSIRLGKTIIGLGADNFWPDLASL
jgi:acyl-CoA dehydrogenase